MRRISVSVHIALQCKLHCMVVMLCVTWSRAKILKLFIIRKTLKIHHLSNESSVRLKPHTLLMGRVLYIKMGNTTLEQCIMCLPEASHLTHGTSAVYQHGKYNTRPMHNVFAWSLTPYSWDECCIYKENTSFSFKLNRKTLQTLYFRLIRPILEYADVLLTNLTESDSLKMEKVKKRAGKIVSGAIKGTSYDVIISVCLMC